MGTVDPRFTFQVGGNADNNTLVGFTSGVGINSTGDVFITGITTSNKFVGIGSDLTLLDADNITSGNFLMIDFNIVKKLNFHLVLL